MLQIKTCALLRNGVNGINLAPWVAYFRMRKSGLKMDFKKCQKKIKKSTVVLLPVNYLDYYNIFQFLFEMR